MIPSYCRVERVIRDIPAQSIIEGGAKISNLRQIVQNKILAEGKHCICIRCREVKSSAMNMDDLRIVRLDYPASYGHEIFLSFENGAQTKLYSFLRLRINNSNAKTCSALQNSAIIREIHTYGPQMAIGQTEKNAIQHRGLGRKLVNEAQKIASEEFGKQKMAVIAGVGVRPYFRKLGYILEKTYMVKELEQKVEGRSASKKVESRK